MSLKESLNEVKQELSNDEKLLEQAFHLERFYKKNKTKILATVALIIIAVAGYNLNSYLKNQKLEAANSALMTLQKDPNNKDALQTLKSKNPKLYTLYKYSHAVNSQDAKALQALNSSDELISDIINYHKAALQNKANDSKYYANLALVEKAYALIKSGKKSEAKNILAKVPKNSALAPVARLMEHYTIK
jgi:predicted negative regulator of RcsB-dependent stress response